MKYIITLLITALATSLTAAPPEGGKGKKPGGPRKLPPQIVKKFDADGDGKLSEAEMANAHEEMKKRREERLKAFDKDGDGKLTGNEQITALKSMLEKSEGMKKKMIERFDADKSGDLSDAEIGEAAKGFSRGGPKGKKPGGKKGKPGEGKAGGKKGKGKPKAE